MSLTTKTITPQIDSPFRYIGKCWKYKALVILMVKRELSIKYANTQVGKWWLLIYPLATLSVYTIVSHYLFKIQSGDTPYVLVAFSGIIPWMFFSTVVINSASVFQANRDLVKKTYFPRAVLLIVKMLVGMLEMGVTLLIYFLFIPIFQFHLTSNIWMLPLGIACNALVALSFTLWITVISTRFKDIVAAVPLLINLMLWLTPVFYPATIIPKSILPLAYCNPMAFVIDTYRFSLTGAGFEPLYWAISLAVTFTLFISGIWFFIKQEDYLVENI